MDLFTFTAEAIRALAWPAAVVAVALMLRKPTIELLPFLRKLKYRELELEFSRDLAQLKTAAKDFKLTECNGDKPIIASTSIDRLFNIASISTSAAILEAWSELESASIAVASSFWEQPSNDVFRNYPRLGEYLLQCKVFDDEQLAFFNQLRDLRNRAAHAVALNISEHEARTYIELASTLSAYIRKANGCSQKSN